MNEFWSHYLKPVHGKKSKLCYTDTNNITVYIKTEDLYLD